MTQTLYSVETGYGFSDRFSFTRKTATELLRVTEGEWIRKIWRGNQPISYEELVEDARKEDAK